MKHQPLVLIVLDGWGYRENPAFNAIEQAKTPTWHKLWSEYPHTLINASGLAVGLPEGQMGNSEVGHLHMGVGRSVPQDLVRVDLAIKEGSFQVNAAFNQAFELAKSRNSTVHILGLLSPGGVHSHERHIQALIALAAQRQVKKLCLHAILDGRDTPPRSALASIALIDKALHQFGYNPIASLCGRFYAMDRDKRWERTQTAYDMYTSGEAAFYASSPTTALERAYAREESDEFVRPTLISPQYQNTSTAPQNPESAEDRAPIIRDNDVVVFMNFRADRTRQLTRAFIEADFNYFPRKTTPKLASFVTLTQYADDLKTQVAFTPINLNNVVGQCVADAGLKQLRIAETEKYAHVTFFFNGGREAPFPHEDRIIVPSPKISTYDLQPEMSAPELTEKLCEAIKSQQYATIICNYANADMVGHSGNLAATIKAIEAIDNSLAKILDALLSVGGEALITSDHGNAEFMFDELTHQAHTAHTTNPVPVIYVGRHCEVAVTEGNLADIGPTMLMLLGLKLPPEMTARPLFKLLA
jgi:2,3-bisphosphoglycerate-independent phosphoglycerate mutase